jgi:cobalt-zinc-cadmium efflux system membrane fusion protein
MRRPTPVRGLLVPACIAIVLIALTGCGSTHAAAPRTETVELQPGEVRVDHPELFKLAKVESRELPTELTANGTITPDITKTIRVTSLGSGRVTDLKVRLGDYVHRGQVLLSISSPDLAQAAADFQKAKADEALSRKALDRAQLLYSHGAMAEKDLQVAEDAEEKAKVDVQTAEQRIRVLGGDAAHYSSVIELRAPVSGTIVEQNVSGFEGVKSLDNSPNLFTIADLSQVWVVCDVFENDLGKVAMGDSAEVRLNAFPDRVFKGKVADISRVLDPNTRSAKVRIVLDNPEGALRPGMYAVATFRSRTASPQLVVPSTAIMRLHDKDWVFIKRNNEIFKQTEITAAGSLDGGLSLVKNGVSPDEMVVADALQFSTEVAANR